MIYSIILKFKTAVCGVICHNGYDLPCVVRSAMCGMICHLWHDLPFVAQSHAHVLQRLQSHVWKSSSQLIYVCYSGTVSHSAKVVFVLAKCQITIHLCVQWNYLISHIPIMWFYCVCKNRLSCNVSMTIVGQGNVYQ